MNSSSNPLGCFRFTRGFETTINFNSNILALATTVESHSEPICKGITTLTPAPTAAPSGSMLVDELRAGGFVKLAANVYCAERDFLMVESADECEAAAAALNLSVTQRSCPMHAQQMRLPRLRGACVFASEK